jgi:hypothetical protein
MHTVMSVPNKFMHVFDGVEAGGKDTEYQPDGGERFR